MELKTYFAQDRNGNVIPSANVSIFLTGTTTLASGLTNVSGAPLANPFTADADGKIQFRAPDGIYDMQVSLGSTTGVKVTFQCVDVERQLSDANRAADRAESAADSIEEQAASITVNTREQWRRTLAEIGLNLVVGSFEDGATVNNSTDAVWHIAGAQCYTWDGDLPKFVNSDSTPESSGSVGLGKWVSVGYSSLRNNLASISGHNLIGGATYTSLRAYTGNETEIYVVGRSSVFDGASGWFDKVTTPGLVDDDGIVLISANGDKWLRRDRYEVNVLWFGAYQPGGMDSSEAINKALVAANKNNNGRVGLPPVVRIPSGNYTINGMIQAFDWANGTIICDGAYFSGTSSESMDAVFQINNASNLKITGSCTITTNGLSNYKSAFDITASPGGLIKPDTGIVSHVDIFGLTLRESFIGISIGRVDKDTQIAEINFLGCEVMFCAVPVNIKGSQTGASFNGCTLASGVWHTFPSGTKYRTLLMQGGICEINGGEFLNSGVPNTYNLAGIEMQPCVSSTYTNTYGALRMSGALIELNSSLLIVGPGEVTGPYKSDTAFCSISNCGGYSDQFSGGNFVEVYEPTFAGTITLDEACNFYTIEGTRTGYNIHSESPFVKFNVGRTSFGTGFGDWMGGCIGGILKHPLLPVSAASGTTQVFSASAENVLRCDSASGSAGKSRYGVYSTVDGKITVPNGCRNMTISYSGYGPGMSGSFYLKKNGSNSSNMGQLVNGSLTLNATISNPIAGDYYQLIVVPDASSTGLVLSELVVLMEF